VNNTATPFSHPFTFQPARQGQSDADYREARTQVLGIRPPAKVDFSAPPLEGAYFHLGLVLKDDLMPANSAWAAIPGTVLVANVWKDELTAVGAFEDTIKPAFFGLRLHPVELPGCRLVGALCADPDELGYIDEAFGFAAIAPAIEQSAEPTEHIDPAQLYSQISRSILGLDLQDDLPEGLIAHVTYQVGEELITFDAWRSADNAETFFRDTLEPVVKDMFVGKYGLPYQPTQPIQVRCVGVGIRAGLRYAV
jgi:hypothetical protein